MKVKKTLAVACAMAMLLALSGCTSGEALLPAVPAVLLPLLPKPVPLLLPHPLR